MQGISGIRLDKGSGFLSAVFVGNSTPSAPAPAQLLFTNNGTTNSIDTSFTELHPILNQQFFVGDGLTGNGSGAIQKFFIPAGATRLYLGFADGDGYNGDPGAYYDNSGALSVSLRTNANLAPDALVSGTVALEACDDPEQAITFEFRPKPSGTLLKRKVLLTQSGPNSGAFSLPNIPKGTYDIAIKGFCWLQRVLPNVVVNADVSGLSVSLLSADLNNDNSVDPTDFGILVGNYNETGDL